MNRFEFYDRLKDYNSLSHADKYGPASGTNKYYAKLDDFYGKGKPRYFYSKEEWDGYQKSKKSAEEADRYKNDPKYQAQKKNYKQNEGYAENAGKNKAVKQKINSNPEYEKSKKYAEQQSQAEAERWNNTKIKNNPQYLNVEGKYIEPVEDIYQELQFKSYNSKDGWHDSRIHQSSIVDYLYLVRDGSTSDTRDNHGNTWYGNLKDLAYEEIDKRFNKKDAEAMKTLIENLHEDIDGVSNYVNKSTNKYSEYLNKDTDKIHDAIYSGRVDGKRYDDKKKALKIVMDQIDSDLSGVYYNYIRNVANAKDYYKFIEKHGNGWDDFNFRDEIYDRIAAEVGKKLKKEIPEEYWEYIPKKYKVK